MYALIIKDIVLVINHSPAPISSRHRCFREIALQIRIGRARNVWNQLLCVCQPTRGTHDNEKYNSGCEVRADRFTAVEVVDSSCDVGVGIRHEDGLLVREMSEYGTTKSIFIAKLTRV
jgi:hypothetical protein